MSLEPKSSSVEFSRTSDQRKSSASNASSKKVEATTTITTVNEMRKSADSAESFRIHDDVNNKINDDENEVNGEHPTEWNYSMNIPQSSFHHTSIEIPAEEVGRGVNRHVYFVCTTLGDEWIELPSATPHQINVARRIKKRLSGNLDADLSTKTYPIFPGTERNYLRAIIARISAGTHVAPKNFYKSGNSEDFDDDEYDEDDEDTCSKFKFH